MRLALALVALLAGPCFPMAAEDQPGDTSAPRRLTGEDLRREVTGNTLSGRHSSGMPYSEYHAPDGRVFGHNNHEPVQFGCWAIKDDEICYRYEGGNIPGVFCWRFFRAQGGFTIYLPRSGTVGTAKLEPGNPHSHSDNGRAWGCDALLSMR